LLCAQSTHCTCYKFEVIVILDTDEFGMYEEDYYWLQWKFSGYDGPPRTNVMRTTVLDLSVFDNK
jgi:hypothetical protein